MPVGTGYVPLRDRYCSLLLALNIKSEEYWKGGGDVLHEICETDFNQWSIDEQNQTSSYWILGFFCKKKLKNRIDRVLAKIWKCYYAVSCGSKKSSQRWWYCVCVCRAKHLIFDLTRLLGRWKMQRERSCDCLS